MYRGHVRGPTLEGIIASDGLDRVACFVVGHDNPRSTKTEVYSAGSSSLRRLDTEFINAQINGPRPDVRRSVWRLVVT